MCADATTHPHPHHLVSCATRRAYNPVWAPTHARLVPCMACCWGSAMSHTSTLGFLHGCDAGLHGVVLGALCCPERHCWTLPPHYPPQSNAPSASSDCLPAPLPPPSSLLRPSSSHALLTSHLPGIQRLVPPGRLRGPHQRRQVSAGVQIITLDVGRMLFVSIRLYGQAPSSSVHNNTANTTPRSCPHTHDASVALPHAPRWSSSLTLSHFAHSSSRPQPLSLTPHR